MPAHRPPSPHPTPGDTAQTSNTALTTAGREALVTQEAGKPLRILEPDTPPPAPGAKVIAARVSCILAGTSLATGFAMMLALDVTGTALTVAEYLAGAGVVGVLFTAPRTCRPAE